MNVLFPAAVVVEEEVEEARLYSLWDVEEELGLAVVALWMAPGRLLSSYLDVEGLGSVGLALKSAPAWFLSSYLDAEELGLVGVALFVFWWDLDLSLVPCPGVGRIASVVPSLIQLFGWVVGWLDG